MTKGIREFAKDVFNAGLANRAEVGNTAFRADVMNQLIVAYGINIGSAATHYNHAKKEAEKNTPELVVGLGRAPDKLGGRKPIHTVDVVKAKTGEVVASGLSKAAANLLISKAEAAKKPKLMIKAVEVAATTGDAATDAAAIVADATQAVVEAPVEAAAPEAPAETTGA